MANTSRSSQTPTTSNPKERGPKPPFPQKSLDMPGLESDMDPKPDYGLDSYEGSGKLLDRVAIITGGDSGIGRAVALAFAREGADVAISYLEVEETDAQETIRAVEHAGRRALGIPGDIRDERHCIEIVEHTVRHFGRLDILVNNAAFQSSYQSIHDITSEDWVRAFETNIHPMFYLSRAALKHLPLGGSIINTTSIQGFNPSPQLLHYASSKGAINVFTQGLSQIALEQSVRVNAVAPAPVWTPLIPSTLPEEAAQSFGKGNPMGRPAQPAELAAAYVYFASDDSQFVSGQILGVTGGISLT